MSTDYLKNIAIIVSKDCLEEVKNKFNPIVREQGVGLYLFFDPYIAGGMFVLSINPKFRYLVSEDHFNGVLTMVAFLENELHSVDKELSENGGLFCAKQELTVKRSRISLELKMHGFYPKTKSKYVPEEQYQWGV